ncbi:hypothetical protein AB0G04_36960 [Actinoplanes sp. NPDC023801]|uniref:hypothetical protein n=1 Tax=Actinoplanes sp. NPDC023801 TaxID=3154595 RepID=UPI0033FCBEE4
MTGGPGAPARSMTGGTAGPADIGPDERASIGTLPERADLRALDADALAALANRGLVKRAAREVGQEPPGLSADGTAIVAEFSDGVRAALPEGGLEQGRCSCGATGVCRHLIGLILAYQSVPVAADVPSPSAEPAPEAARVAWSPGGFTDDELTTRIGARLVTAARRAERAGYTARVRRGPVPVVELPAATVRFLVPGDLGYVHTDARAGNRDDVIALAVWAFRVADEQQPDIGECVVDVGGSGGTAAAGSGLEAVVEFAAEVLRAGAVHAGPGLAAAVAGHLAALERAGLRWPLDAAAELAEQLTAYRERGARYSPELLADLVAELFARHRAATADGAAAARSRVLGSEEAAETPLRRVRLDGLGARVTAIDGERRVEIFHGQAASGVVLVSHRQWTTTDDGPALSRRRIAGTTVGAVAGGTLVTESAVRNASRAVRLSAGRVAKSTVTVSSGAWDALPGGLLVRDYAGLAAELDAMPPRPVRARVRAELVRVLEIAEVGPGHYSPGAQRLTFEISDAHGNTATVVATHAAVAPGRLDAVAAALDGRRGRPRYVAGSVHRSGGRVVIDPYSIAADGPPVIPDLTAPNAFAEPAAAPSAAAPSAVTPSGAAPSAVTPSAVTPPAAAPPAAAVPALSAAVPPSVSGPGSFVTGDGAGSSGMLAGSDLDAGVDVLAAAVAFAREVLAEAAHRGLAQLPPAYTGRLGEARNALARAGLHRVASAIDEVSARLSPDPGIETVDAWVDAYLRVSLAADLL